MTLAYTLYITVILSLAAYYAVATLLFTRGYDDRLCLAYIKSLTAALLGCTTPSVVAHSRREKAALTKALCTILSHSYDTQRESIQHIIRENNLEQFIIGQLRHASSHKRAELLLQLGTLSTTDKHSALLLQHIRSRHHRTQISALLSLLNTAPKRAIEQLSSAEFRLSPFELSCIVSLLRQGCLPIAFEPLLESQHYNLKMLGLALVRTFELSIASKIINRIIAQDKEQEIVHEALYTLASLKRPLNTLAVQRRIFQMSTPERRAFCRHLSREGYSLQAIERLLPDNETDYAERLITSYKRQLAATN